MNGFIIIHRKIVEWGWYSDPNTFRVFLHLLLTANFKDTEYLGRRISRGQTVIGLHSLSEILTISVRAVRTALKNLKSTNEIATESTTKFTIVTICNYEKYQDKQCDSGNPKYFRGDKRTTNERQTNDKRTTTLEQGNKETRITKKETAKTDPVIPEHLNEIWPEYLKMRRGLRRPATQLAQKLAIEKLKKLSTDKNAQIKMVEQSIENSWQGLFPLKTGGETSVPRQGDHIKAEDMYDEL